MGGAFGPRGLPPADPFAGTGVEPGVVESRTVVALEPALPASMGSTSTTLGGAAEGQPATPRNTTEPRRRARPDRALRMSLEPTP